MSEKLWGGRFAKPTQAFVHTFNESISFDRRLYQQDIQVPMPGYTHLQHAQPVTWGHWLLSHFWSLVRDRRRFDRVRRDTAELPLGSGALAGTAFSINREELAQELGFDTLSQNSMDTVSNRDFVADFLYACAMVGLHLGHFSEQLIIFASQKFGFVLLDDGYSTGSSLMPQKKNPDTLELTRGKSGRLLSKLTGFLTTLKGLPSTAESSHSCHGRIDQHALTSARADDRTA